MCQLAQLTWLEFQEDFFDFFYFETWWILGVSFKIVVNPEKQGIIMQQQPLSMFPISIQFQNKKSQGSYSSSSQVKSTQQVDTYLSLKRQIN